jgi:hypothetical protein
MRAKHITKTVQAHAVKMDVASFDSVKEIDISCYGYDAVTATLSVNIAQFPFVVVVSLPDEFQAPTVVHKILFSRTPFAA